MFWYKGKQSIQNTPNLNTMLNTEFINDEPIPKRVKLDVNETYL